MRSNAGFTLIELIVTVAVIATMSAIAVPNFIQLIDNHKLSSAVTDIWVLLQQARIYAAKEQAHVVLTFDPDNDGSIDGEYLMFVDDGTDPKTRWTREPGERILHRRRLPDGISFHDVSFAGGIPRTRFNSRGFPNGLGGHVYLKNIQKKFLGLHLNLNGNPRIVQSDSGEKGTWN
jgi:type IV fimbrial biogenesis protein FimT